MFSATKTKALWRRKSKVSAFDENNMVHEEYLLRWLLHILMKERILVATCFVVLFDSFDSVFFFLGVFFLFPSVIA